MKELRAADRTDAIVDGLRWRRAEVYVPSSLRPLSVPDLALPRRIKRIVRRTFRSDQIARARTHQHRRRDAPSPYRFRLARELLRVDSRRPGKDNPRKQQTSMRARPASVRTKRASQLPRVQEREGLRSRAG